MREKLTKSKIEKIEPSDRDFDVVDLEQPSLTLRVRKSGGKVYRSSFKHKGKLYRETIGPADSISLAFARERAREIRESIISGKVIKTYESKGRVTVGHLMDKFMKEEVSRKEERTKENYTRHTAWMKSNYGHIELEEFSRELAKQSILNFTKGREKSFKVFLISIRRAFNFAVEEEMIQSNPYTRIKPPKEKPRMIHADEGQLIKIRESILAETNPITKGFYFLILNTICRRGEASLMRWRDIVEGVWEKPAETTKGKRLHRVKLNQEVLDVLAEIPRNGEDNFVFQGFCGFGRAWTRIIKRAGLEGSGIRLHDLRTSFGIWLLKNKKASIYEISNMLGHSNVIITQKFYAPYLGDNADVGEAIGSFYIKS